MDPKSQNQKNEGKATREYDLTACDLELLEALLHASPGSEMKEAIYNEIQRRRWPPPGLRPRTRQRHKQRSLI